MNRRNNAFISLLLVNKSFHSAHVFGRLWEKATTKEIKERMYRASFRVEIGRLIE